MYFLDSPEVIRGDRHGLGPDGAGGGDHEEKEAADSHHLEGSVEDGPRLEPGLLLHLLHDDGQSEHTGGCHGYSGGDNLENIIGIESLI